MKREIIQSPFVLRHWLYGDCLKPPPRIIALDTETTSLRYINLDIIGFSLCDGKKACYVDVRNKYRDKLLGLLSYYLIEYDPLVIMHNAPFDLMVLRKVGVV